jgi:PAS domain-containing protein
VIEEFDPTYDVEKRYVRKNGEVIWVHVNSKPVRDAEELADCRNVGLAARSIEALGNIEDEVRTE